MLSCSIPAISRTLSRSSSMCGVFLWLPLHIPPSVCAPAANSIRAYGCCRLARQRQTMKKDHAAVRWLAQHAVRAGRARSGAVVEVLGPHGGNAPATALAYAIWNGNDGKMVPTILRIRFSECKQQHQPRLYLFTFLVGQNNFKAVRRAHLR